MIHLGRPALFFWLMPYPSERGIWPNFRFRFARFEFIEDRIASAAGEAWEYLFYLDFIGRDDEQKVQNALNHLREQADFLRVLGSYPKGG